MIVNMLSELTISGVVDRGIANSERIAIQVNETINTGQYGVMVGHQTVNCPVEMAIPIKDHLFWFGDAILNKNDWIFIYTGPGKAFVSDLENGNKLYSTYWDKQQTIFAQTNIVPMLFKADAVQVGGVAQNALQN
ncbi:hypothetical protein [Cognaticolwellia mytili]|uniref:hypothetical protein n=1 Tax=Cognaticolwellia mytili TaxID=1888913 RepID=UPI000A17466E|nr:hypothetical protein [Cognaticolwellia mytili]